MINTRPNKSRLFLVLLHLGFFVSGISTVIIGQFLPLLAKKFTLNDAQSSYFFWAQFTGSLAGTILTNWLGKKHKFLAATFVGCFLMAAGVPMLGVDNLEISLAGFVINGLGIGLTLPAINMLVLELNPKRPAAALSILNFFWGFGAIVCQPFVDLTTSGTSIFLPTVILSAVLWLIGIPLFLMPRSLEPKPLDDREPGALIPIWTHPIAWAIALFNFVHVGFETAIIGWMKTYTERVSDIATLIPPVTLYFMFFVLGRWAAPVLFRFFSENVMLMLGLVIILIGMGIVLSTGDIVVLSFGASIAGFGTSWVFPTNMSRFTRIFGASASRRATPFFICGTLGAAFTTWIIGYISNQFNNNLWTGMMILIGSIVFLIVLQVPLGMIKKQVTN